MIESSQIKRQLVNRANSLNLSTMNTLDGCAVYRRVKPVGRIWRTHSLEDSEPTVPANYTSSGNRPSARWQESIIGGAANYARGR